MTALEYILEGFEAELALERELGVRSVEIDRSLLAPVLSGEAQVRAAAAPRDGLMPKGAGLASVERIVSAPRAERPPDVPRPEPESRAVPAGGLLDFVFLHDRPLSPGGAEMMAKIASAMGKTPETAPVVHEKPIPRARIYVVLGGLALRKWFPGRNASPGSWIRSEKGLDVLVTYSPEYILRFKVVTPALKKIKSDMWVSLKGVIQRIRQ